MLNTLQLEVLQEVINIGVGKGAEVLNTMVQSHISLEVPEVKLFGSNEYDQFVDIFGETTYSIITLPFNGELNGFSKLIMSSEHAAKLVDAFIGKHGASIEMDSLRVDILSEIGNIITNAVMGTMGNMLTLDLGYVVPNYELGSKNIIIPKEIISSASAILFAQTHFKIEEFETKGNFAIFFNLSSFETLIYKIQQFLDSNLSPGAAL
jgi:chemotaxis protein CheC